MAQQPLQAGRPAIVVRSELLLTAATPKAAADRADSHRAEADEEEGLGPCRKSFAGRSKPHGKNGGSRNELFRPDDLTPSAIFRRDRRGHGSIFSEFAFSAASFEFGCGHSSFPAPGTGSGLRCNLPTTAIVRWYGRRPTGQLRIGARPSPLTRGQAGRAGYTTINPSGTKLRHLRREVNWTDNESRRSGQNSTIGFMTTASSYTMIRWDRVVSS